MHLRGFFQILFLTLALLINKVAACQEISENAQNITQSSNTSSFINAVYFTNWGTYDRNFQPNDISLQFITHVFYAFLDVRPDGTVFSNETYPDIEKHYAADSWSDQGNNVYGCVKQLHLLKKNNRNLKLMLSIGGSKWSSNFAGVASSDSFRKTFAKTAVETMIDWGFDGLDIDWEYPQSVSDANNFVLLLQAVRAELDAYTKKYTDYHFLLSIAVTANPENYGVLEINRLGQVVDYMTLMAYDYAGSWSTATGHTSNLYLNKNCKQCTPFNTDQAVRAYISGGMPSTKILLGMPTYGRAFQNTEGPGKPFTGVGGGSWESGIWDYKTLPKKDAYVQCDDDVQACWSFDANSKELISFDTPELIKAKVAYIKSRQLGGSIFWEASGDKKSNGSLVKASFEALANIAQVPNNLEYPSSKYDNIKS